MKPSVLGNITDFIIGNAITIPITKYNASYSDTLNIYIGNTWIKRVEKLVNNQSVSFTTAELETIYETMAYVTAASFRFVNTTYNGSNIVGTSEKAAKGTFNEDIKPTINSVSLTEAISEITNKFGGYVQYQSRINVSMDASPGQGTGIYGYSGNVGSYVVMELPITTNYLSKSGTNDYSLTITDQRNRTATTSGTFEVLEYDNPKITNFSVVRCDADGTENLYGDNVKINASAYISSVNNKNDKLFKVQYKLRDVTTWTDLLTNDTDYAYILENSVHAGFNADYAYDFRLVVTDYFHTVETPAVISTAYSIIDIRRDGQGIAFGKASTKNALEIGMNVYDRFDTVVNNGLAVYRPNGVDIDPDTTLEELVLTETNTPESGFWYVRTMFYSNKSETVNRTQVAYPYNNVSTSMYYRCYYMTGWSEWKSLASIANTIDYEGIFISGKTIQETGWVTITPQANIPTTVKVNFSQRYKNIPVVIPVASSGVIGAQVLGFSTNGIYHDGVNITLTRTNTIPTTVYYYVIGEV